MHRGLFDRWPDNPAVRDDSDQAAELIFQNHTLVGPFLLTVIDEKIRFMKCRCDMLSMRSGRIIGIAFNEFIYQPNLLGITSLLVVQVFANYPFSADILAANDTNQSEGIPISATEQARLGRVPD